MAAQKIHKRRRRTTTLADFGFGGGKRTTPVTHRVGFSETDTRTKVCNCRVKYIRPAGFDNLRDWMDDPNHVYVGRRGIVFLKNKSGQNERFPKKHSLFANIHRLAAVNYKKWIRAQILDNPQRFGVYTIGEKDDDEDDDEETIQLALMGLKGKTLGCWCVQSACVPVEGTTVASLCCHAQMLAHMADN